MAAWVVVLGIALAALILLGYGVFLGVLTSGPTQDGDGLMGPFRWFSSSEMA